MQFRLRTLLIVLAVGPGVLAQLRLRLIGSAEVVRRYGNDWRVPPKQALLAIRPS